MRVSRQGRGLSEHLTRAKYTHPKSCLPLRPVCIHPNLNPRAGLPSVRSERSQCCDTEPHSRLLLRMHSPPYQPSAEKVRNGSVLGDRLGTVSDSFRPFHRAFPHNVVCLSTNRGGQPCPHLCRHHLKLYGERAGTTPPGPIAPHRLCARIIRGQGAGRLCIEGDGVGGLAVQALLFRPLPPDTAQVLGLNAVCATASVPAGRESVRAEFWQRRHHAVCHSP